MRYLSELPDTWRKATGGLGRQLLASAPFDRIDVLGLREATVYVSAGAARHGLAAVLPPEFRSVVGDRGERRRTGELPPQGSGPYSSPVASPSGPGSRGARIHTSCAVVVAPTFDRAFAR